MFLNQFGLQLCQHRPPLRESQAQMGKTMFRALNDGQNSVALLDRVAVDQPCIDDVHAKVGMQDSNQSSSNAFLSRNDRTCCMSAA